MTHLSATRAVPCTMVAPFTFDDVMALRATVIVHDLDGCTGPDGPTGRLHAFLDVLAVQLRALGTDKARAQIWASLHTLE